MTLLPPRLTVWLTYEMLENTNAGDFLESGVKVMEYLPSISVTTPVVVPSIITAAPTIGAPETSFTVPRTVILFCAERVPDKSSIPASRHTAALSEEAIAFLNDVKYLYIDFITIPD